MSYGSTSARPRPVLLVGAGPGSVDLLTVGALRALEEADVVVHDRLVSAEILDVVPRRVRRVPVGKHKGGGCAQHVINRVLIDEALAGHRVTRLKGGDPYVFGRGGEEVEALGAAGIETRVIPGVSSALAAPALAGIPVTHRGVSSSCTIISGHLIDEADYDWAMLARTRSTLVVLMASTTAADIASRLLDHGRPPSEPVAIVHAAGTPQQRQLHMDLRRLHTHGCPLPSPCVIVIGPTAAMPHRSGACRISEG